MTHRITRSAQAPDTLQDRITRSLTATQRKSLQYIVTMNSDTFGRLPLAESIDLSEVVLETRLSDDGEEGGLFGFRFG